MKNSATPTYQEAVWNAYRLLTSAMPENPDPMPVDVELAQAWATLAVALRPGA